MAGSIAALPAAAPAGPDRAGLLDAILASSRAGIIVFGPDRRVVLRNSAFVTLLDLPADALPPGTSHAGMLETLARRGEFSNIDAPGHVRAMLDADYGVPRNFRRARPNGTILESVADPMPDGGYVIHVSDVTALARAEAEARSRAATLDSVLAALPQGISLFGPDRRLLMANPAYHVIMGEAAARPGETMAEVIERRRRAGEYGPGERGDAYAAETQLDHSRPARRRRTRPDGTTIDVRTAPLPDGGHISVVTDITLEVAAQAELERRTAMLDLMMAHVNHGMALFDAAERVVVFNAQMEVLAGIAPGWLRAGRSRQEIIAHLHERGVYGGGAAADALVSDFRARDPRRIQRVERVLPDGRVIEMRSDPLPAGGYVVAIWDVTWRRETEAQLRAAKDAAEAASRAKSSFLATISHELRTPLNAVIGFSEAIGHECDGRPDDDAAARRVGEYAQAVNDAGRHLLGLINDILDVARIESGRVDLTESVLDLAELIGSCRRTMDPAARAARVALAVDLPARLPRLKADERRLRQVLLNLLSNAVKFTPAGGEVRLTAIVAADGGLVIIVRDSGIGIGRENIERAFEPFTQLDALSARRAGGSGLGLFLSRALAAAHGGTLDLESTLGQGTTAILRLPASRVLRDHLTGPVTGGPDDASPGQDPARREDLP